MDSNSFHGITRQKIALLIDFDNVILGIDDPGFDVEIVVNALRERGLIVMGRAYGDWYRHNRHRRRLMENGIDLIETPVFGPIIKNSADMHMALDAFEVAITQPHIDTFCIVSGDSDFLPLIKRLQSRDKTVIVIAGHRFTSELVRRNCNEYLAYENLLAESVGAAEDVTSIEGAYQLLHRTIDTLQERDIEVRSSTVKQMMVQLNPAFSERNFGCHQFKQFLDRATRAGIVTLNPSRGTAGESIVLLNPETEIQNVEAPPREAPSRETAAREIAARDNRRDDNRRDDTRGNRNDRDNRDNDERNKRGRRGDERKDEKPVASDTPAVEAKADAPAENQAAKSEWNDPNSMLGRVPLRRGRLRYSAREGRTVINRPAPPADDEAANTAVANTAVESTAVENTAVVPVADAKTEDRQSEDVTPEAAVATIAAATPETSEAAPQTQAEEATSSDADDNEAKKPARKRSTRGGRKRKAAEEAVTEATVPEAAVTEDAAEENVAVVAQTEPEAPSETVSATAGEESEAPKKKPRSRRKTAATKKAEAKTKAESEDITAPATEETAAKDASDLNATPVAESAPVANANANAPENAEGEAPKPKRRRRTPTKKPAAKAEAETSNE